MFSRYGTRGPSCRVYCPFLKELLCRYEPFVGSVGEYRAQVVLQYPSLGRQLVGTDPKTSRRRFVDCTSGQRIRGPYRMKGALLSFARSLSFCRGGRMRQHTAVVDTKLVQQLNNIPYIERFSLVRDTLSV